MDARQRADLDRYITGNYGEDQNAMTDDEMNEARLDQEDDRARDQWAEDHGYSSYTCPIHGRFWSDSGDPCPHCETEEPCE